MLFSLLEEAAPKNNTWVSYVLIGVLVVILIVSMILMNRRSKKREEEAKKLIDAVKPGNKVKTIGGVCGIVVEVDPEEDTFVLETGSEGSGKCYMKFVRQAILESDAVVDKDAAPADKEEKAEDNTAEAETQEAKPEETAAEDKTADKE
ncbi:MAG: preprotein translocase subunit YajC [Clostridia bacterium]|nr:preprotein translocase subunit YajC [Clostridia bacterium]